MKKINLQVKERTRIQVNTRHFAEIQINQDCMADGCFHCSPAQLLQDVVIVIDTALFDLHRLRYKPLPDVIN